MLLQWTKTTGQLLGSPHYDLRRKSLITLIFHSLTALADPTIDSVNTTLCPSVTKTELHLALVGLRPKLSILLTFVITSTALLSWA